MTRLRLGFVALPQGAVLASGAAFAQGPVARPATPVAAASASQPALAVLVGRWVRPDGGYVINIKAADASGKLDASYANPNPLPFYTAEATRDSGVIRLFFELRAGGYNGSTYSADLRPGKRPTQGRVLPGRGEATVRGSVRARKVSLGEAD